LPGTRARRITFEATARQTNDAFAGTTFINGGLPIHIGAALLGHMDLQTTQGCVAVFAEDIVASHQQFLNHAGPCGQKANTATSQPKNGPSSRALR
jgi:hypothetical protein